MTDATLEPTEVPEIKSEPARGGKGPRSRRAFLAATAGSLIGALGGLIGRPLPADAAAGDNLKLGQANYAGTAATRLNTTSSGGAFWMTQNGTGSGVRGDSPNGHGGVFTTSHPSRYGLYAQSLAASGGSGGAAIRAEGGAHVGLSATSDGAAAVYGVSPGFYGVAGQSSTSVGVLGQSSSGYGVYASSSTSYAGYFAGDINVTGSVDGPTTTMRLDHPLAPAEKVLTHAGVVSDERKTVYDGTVTTDASGEATVTLPAWFGALNTDLRYQLTPFADVRAWVKSEVKDHRFVIATSEPGTKVCWQLTGVRADPYAKAYPLVVESTKTGREKGRYLNPVELGQPASKGVDAEERQRVAG